MNTMEELPTRSKDRIEFLQASFIEGDLTEDEFELFLDAAFDDEPPFFYDWFETKLKTNEARHKRYANDQIYVYCGDEYELDGKKVVEIEDTEDVDRTISVTGPVGETVEAERIIEDEGELSDEAKAKQQEIRDAILGR